MINEEPDYWPRYTIKDHHRLRHQFSQSERVRRNWSQSMQDMFVLSMLDGKRNGVYVETVSYTHLTLPTTPYV